MTVIGGRGEGCDRAVSLLRQESYVHEAVYFDGADDLVDATAPLLGQALAQGADVALVCTERHNGALVEALGDDDRVRALPRADMYRKAVTAVAFFRDFVEQRIAAGAGRVCVLGEADFATEGRALDEWRRYEALLNHAINPYPLWHSAAMTRSCCRTRCLPPASSPIPTCAARGCRRRTRSRSTPPS
jgi:hypothetical protein